MTKVLQERVFANTGTFQAMYAAEAWLAARGFSIGPSQAGAPRAIWHDDSQISKWRNLSAEEKRDVHAIMDGNMRDGPVQIKLMPGATDSARAAFALTNQDIRGNPVVSAACCESGSRPPTPTLRLVSCSDNGGAGPDFGPAAGQALGAENAGGEQPE